MENLLEFAVLIIILAAVFLFIMFFKPKYLEERVEICKFNDKPRQKVEGKIIVIFGASGSIGKKYLDYIIENYPDFKVIAVSRKYKNWFNCTCENRSKYLNVDWLRCDIRLDREVEYTLKYIQNNFGTPDMYINCCVIGRPNVIPSGFRTGRDRDAIFVRLENATVKNVKIGLAEASNPFFTNFIGLTNLLHLQPRYLSKDGSIHIPSGIDNITDALIQEFKNCDLAKYTNFVVSDFKSDLNEEKEDGVISRLKKLII